MRIVLFGPAYPFRGGISHTSGALFQALQKAGHDVIAVNYRKQFPRLLFPGKTQLDTSPYVPNVPSNRSFTLWNPLTWIRTARAIARHDPDLIVFSWWMPFFGLGYWAVARLLPKRLRKRIIFLLHNVIPHERRIGDVFQSRLALKMAVGYVALSLTEEHALRELFPRVKPDRIRYSPLPLFEGCPLFEGSQRAAQDRIGASAERLLLFFGFVREYKGLDVLLRAMPEILKNDPQIKLMIAGEFYQDRSTYDQLISSLGIENVVMIHDHYLAGDAVGTYFAAADCLVLPYRSATQSAIAQVAYALGMPMITTDVGSMAEVVKDGVCGYVVPPGDPHAIAEAVGKYYRAGGKAAFEDNVRREAQRFSWSALVDAIMSIEIGN